jgi:cystathionine beta-lyase
MSKTGPAFDTPPDRRGTNCAKWDAMETLYGVSPDDGISMWVADSDYAAPDCVRDVVRKWADHGAFGYAAGPGGYLDAIVWWMNARHGWSIQPDWILTSNGLGNAIGLCLDVLTEPGAPVAIFSPVYHEFAGKITRAGRVVTECPLRRDGDTYVLDLDDAQSRLTGAERMLIWCSPQNPSGRVWTTDELRAVAAFAAKNDMILVSDEIHHDLVYAPNRFVPTHVAAPDCESRLIVLTAASKTFNIAGLKTGNLIIPDADLRAKIAGRMEALFQTPNVLGMEMVTAAYSPEGAAWVDAQIAYLDGNRKAFDALVNSIPGVRSMPLQSTYLAWVDFSGTGMTVQEIEARVRDGAKIAASQGPTFGTGGAQHLRFNLATSRARVEEAGRRLVEAFQDLQ